MATIFIPTMLQKMADGAQKGDMEVRNGGEVIERLEEICPGIKDRLLEDGDIAPNIAVAIDGDVAIMGLFQRVGENSEVHFVPAIGGGF